MSALDNVHAVYSFDPTSYTINRREVNGVFPARCVQLGSGTVRTLEAVRAGILSRVAQSPRDTEFLVAVWQDVLQTYFHTWE